MGTHNLQFLGVITYNPHIGGFKTFIFHGFGVQGYLAFQLSLRLDISLNAWNMSPSNSKNLKLYGNFPTFLRIHLCWIFQLTKCLILEVLTRGWWKNYSALISKCLIKGNIFSKLFFVYMLSRETWKENKKKNTWNIWSPQSFTFNFGLEKGASFAKKL